MISGVNKQRVGNFYGRSIPRPLGKVDEVGNLIKDPANPLPSANAPVLDWAKKADWQNGGSVHTRHIGTLPKKPVSAESAFLIYKTAILSKDHPDLPRKELKRLVESEETTEWSKLQEQEKQVFRELAKEDEERYQKEMQVFNDRNPGWMEWHGRHLQEGHIKADPTAQSAKGPRKPATFKKPRPPMSPWMAYVQAQTQKKLDADPELKAGLALTVEVMKEASAKWRNLSDRSRAKWIRISKADRKRYEEELDKFPEYREKLRAKQAKKAERKAAKRREEKAKGRTVLGALETIPEDQAADVEDPADVEDAASEHGHADEALDVEMPADKETVSAPQSAKPKANMRPARTSRLRQMEAKRAKTPASPPARKSQKATAGQTAGKAGTRRADKANGENVPPPAPHVPDDISDLSSSDSEDEALDTPKGGALGDGSAPPNTQDSTVILVARNIVNNVRGFFTRTWQAEGGVEPAPAQSTPPATKEAAPGVEGILIGRRVMRYFIVEDKEVPFNGEVTAFNPATGWYRVVYEDGDQEDLNDEELQPFLAMFAQAEEQAKENAGQKRKSPP